VHLAPVALDNEPRHRQDSVQRQMGQQGLDLHSAINCSFIEKQYLH